MGNKKKIDWDRVGGYIVIALFGSAVVLTVLKALGVLHWQLVWCLSPFWIPVLLLAVIAWLFDDAD